MAKIAALAVLLVLTASSNALADENLLVWRIAHERMLAKWRHAEPRCGWTVGGYTCSSPRRSRWAQAMPTK
jgi:hypothetical protein